MSNNITVDEKRPQLTVIEIVEDFERRFHNFELKLSDKGRVLEFIYQNTKQGTQLADDLAKAMSNYEQNKSSSLRYTYAEILLIIINRAKAWGALEEGPGWTSRLAQSEQEVVHLRDERDKLRVDNERLASTVLQLQGRLEQLQFEQEQGQKVRKA